MTRKIQSENGQLKTLHFMIDPKDPGTELIKERFAELIKKRYPDSDVDVDTVVNDLYRCTKDKDETNGLFHIKY